MFQARRVDAGLTDVPQGRALGVTISASYNRYMSEVKAAIGAFRSAGAAVLSPPSGDVTSVHRGFTRLEGDPSKDKRVTEDRHLDAIRRSDLLWIESPDGYTGTSTAFELGYARACGIPTFSRERLEDEVISTYVRQASSPRDALRAVRATRRARATTRSTLLLAPWLAVTLLERQLDVLRRALGDTDGPLDSQTATRVAAAAGAMRETLGCLGDS